jgi:hypothetical protein
MYLLHQPDLPHSLDYLNHIFVLEIPHKIPLIRVLTILEEDYIPSEDKTELFEYFIELLLELEFGFEVQKGFLLVFF